MTWILENIVFYSSSSQVRIEGIKSLSVAQDLMQMFQCSLFFIRSKNLSSHDSTFLKRAILYFRIFNTVDRVNVQHKFC